MSRNEQLRRYELWRSRTIAARQGIDQIPTTAFELPAQPHHISRGEDRRVYLLPAVTEWIEANCVGTVRLRFDQASAKHFITFSNSDDLIYFTIRFA